MLVISKPGTKCPMEGQSREYISDVPVDVPNTSYYRRLIKDGSLLFYVPTPGPQPAKKGGKE